MNKNNMYMIKSSLLHIPMPINISYWWNLGSLLGIFLLIQIISGLFMSMHYCPNINIAFDSIMSLNQNIKFGWLMHSIHMNGSSMFFIFLYMHIGRGLYYNSFKLKNTWMIGTSIFIMSMMTAFLGYVMPWGQMSFWGAMVITNLISTIPYMGNMILEWIWGGFSINNATLNRFYSIHFIMPFIIMFLIIIHLFFLHLTGSSNPLGINSNLNKIPFHYYFTFKDLFIIIMSINILLIITFQYPYNLGDPDNFTPANPMNTPTHIKPEWYFLYAYAILRSIPNKMGGVLALFSSIFILYFLPMNNLLKMNSYAFYPINQFMFWIFINIFIFLTYMGSLPIEPPFMILSQIMSIMYFIYFISMNMTMNIWNKMMY